ncbi:MAG TPA: phosphonate metabolism protein/1,5-bisphosphokinase (PRPP-forming) PhnN [Alphaproteobacteria bacterium]|nr:phosphonate metabolism protein/1,5-bisphosphokinase (PRPP-forming) PhnN [Alphaproteobacteria bacterium]
MSKGTLFMVVGPSGAGKDTLLAGARARLSDDPRYRFIRRTITRPVEAGGEVHEAVTAAEFAARSASRAHFLEWHAHGLSYGISRTVLDTLNAGCHAVVNASRSVLDQARAQYAPCRILVVTVPPALLRARLEARGREDEADIAKRLGRADVFTVTGPDVVTIVNDGLVDAGVTAFLKALGASH